MEQMTMEEYVNKFLELIMYVDYIKDENINISQLLSGFSQVCKGGIEFVETQSMDQVI